MTGEVVSCNYPTLPARPYPAVAAGTVWRCECGVVWKAREYRWTVLGWHLRGYAVRRHMRWVDEQRRSEALRAALSPEDRAWLDSVERSS